MTVTVCTNVHVSRLMHDFDTCQQDALTLMLIVFAQQESAA